MAKENKREHDYYYSWIKVYLMICETFEELKETWNKYRFVINDSNKISILQKQKLIEYKNELKGNFDINA